MSGADVDAKWNPTTNRSIIKFKPVGALKDGSVQCQRIQPSKLESWIKKSENCAFNNGEEINMPFSFADPQGGKNLKVYQ
jgi:hypothetical protein